MQHTFSLEPVHPAIVVPTVLDACVPKKGKKQLLLHSLLAQSSRYRGVSGHDNYQPVIYGTSQTMGFSLGDAREPGY